MNVNVRPRSYLDIEEEVYWLLRKAGGEVAAKLHDAPWQTVEMLKAHPLIGRERQDLRQPGIRSWRVKGYARWLIFYEAEEGKLSL